MPTAHSFYVYYGPLALVLCSLCPALPSPINGIQFPLLRDSSSALEKISYKACAWCLLLHTWGIYQGGLLHLLPAAVTSLSSQPSDIWFWLCMALEMLAWLLLRNGVHHCWDNCNYQASAMNKRIISMPSPGSWMWHAEWTPFPEEFSKWVLLSDGQKQGFADTLALGLLKASDGEGCEAAFLPCNQCLKNHLEDLMEIPVTQSSSLWSTILAATSKFSQKACYMEWLNCTEQHCYPGNTVRQCNDSKDFFFVILFTSQVP